MSLTVGIWLELDPAELAAAGSDARVRHARGLALGWAALPEVDSIVVPCLPSDREAVVRLFAHASDPGRMLSDKLVVVPTGRDPVRRLAVAGWARRLRDRACERLASLAASSGRPALPRHPARVFKRLKLSCRRRLAEAVLAAVDWLPPPHATVVSDLRRRGLSATWLITAWRGTCSRRLPGRKLLDLGGSEGTMGDGRAASEATAVARLAAASDAVVAPSPHVARLVAKTSTGLAELDVGRRIGVVPPAPLPVIADPLPEPDSRRRFATELRNTFSGTGDSPLHRHFCDFPFERIDYVVVSPARPAAAVTLQACAAVIRRHRRNLTFLFDGRLPRGDDPTAGVAAAGLSFDVAEVIGLSESARARLLRHARLVVVPDPGAAVWPPVFGEAVGVGTPVVMARQPAVAEALSAEEVAAPEYFDVDGPPEDRLAAAILHTLDHRADVLARQRAILARLAVRTWRDVAADQLRLLGPD